MRASLSLRNDPAELRRLVDFAEMFARHHALPRTERAWLLLILEELFTNAVSHGYNVEARVGTIEVSLAFDVGRLMIEFRDDGKPFDPLLPALPDLDQPAAKRPVGGLGLYIVRSLVNDARYFRNGDRNHLILSRVIAGQQGPGSGSD
jgi:anti-sigma regulatory factor (Ser/Thr protein kinase)